MTWKPLILALNKLSHAGRRVSDRLYQASPGQRAWWREQGDGTLRLDYDLHEDSVVFDLGGFQGQWASDIYARYRCTIHVFEPVSGYAANIRRRFARNPNIIVHDYGLAGATRVERIAICGDGSSTLKRGGPSETIRLADAVEFLEREEIEEIDLAKINIEGGEYELLERLIDSGTVQRIKDIQVQFHDFVIPDARSRMNKIQERLSATHALTYQYEFVWENWRRKG